VFLAVKGLDVKDVEFATTTEGLEFQATAAGLV
jgi:hypothetical protein